ncbi:MAG: glycerol-3-phosphate 1-O-acyltransferase PlsY [Prosthecobacter sp.]|jgi:glycerol-3-phosphate acyltransferase PlsY|uniref:glycerol-3-phosphate 1-O-acyltransferase PlsY n=1 Tax=Prosthecobacter sp. TaxID=1965333 RepID=UPI0019ECF5EB|nr:glycerol-3-phosphate 1-O-acyltransferase PlsY [Prosthecobacter sp.]MBE2283932.1 glycerol-3-phosphate 1-O-acyltransferase PlsY [Prosthecobacter sp.]
MTTTTAILASIACGYLCGSVPFGYLAGKLKGIDIRKHGSGNIGATNAIRVLGKGIGIPVFLLDVLKGWLPVWLAAGWIAQTGTDVEVVTIGKVLTGFAAVLGHMFTFWLGFKGGKGIATTCGVLAGVSLAGMIGGWIGFLTFLFAFRYVSLGSLAAAVGVPTAMAIQMQREGRWDFVMLGFGIVVMILAFVRHRSNIQRLIAGTESKAFVKKDQLPS